MNGMASLFPIQLKRSASLEEAKNRFSLNDDINQQPYKCANSGEKDYIFPERFILSEKMKLPVPEASETSSVSKKEKKVCKLYVELMDYKPKIYRTLYVVSDIKMSHLAYTLMLILR